LELQDTSPERGGRGPAGGESLPVEQLREQLARRHRRDSVVSEDEVANALLTFSLMRLHSRLSQDFESMHRKLGWTWSGFRILNVLWALGPVDQRDLARLSGDSRAAISSAVKTLERDGLVTRTRVADDRRLVTVSLTRHGADKLTEGMHDQAERERAWYTALSKTERAHLSNLLTQLSDQVRPQ
jgi:DNA-binding MarR family transcriptional regulator